MAEQSNYSRTFSGSSIKFYRQKDNSTRIRVYTTSGTFDFETFLTHAQMVLLANAMLDNGTVMALAGADGNIYTGPNELAPGGADVTVDA